MSIERLKLRAREFERKGQWGKALELYRSAIRTLAQDDERDAALHNRVGDILARTGGVDEAVIHYEQALDLYAEDDLANNAIAVAKKILRIKPSRHSATLRMGQVRATQGFLAEARQHYMAYAERMEAAGDPVEGRRALREFAELAPQDPEIRKRLDPNAPAAPARSASYGLGRLRQGA